MNYDLGSIIAEMVDAEWVEITHPATGDSIGVHILVAGPDSDQYRTAESALKNQALAKLHPGKKMKQMTSESIDKQGTDLLVALTLAWKTCDGEDAEKVCVDEIVINGTPFICNATNARMLYEMPRLSFIRKQVDDFLGERQNFFKKSETQ